MRGKSKIEALTAEWYGFNVFTFLVNLVMAIFGSGLFGAIFAVPFVIASLVISLFITWGIGTLLVKRSQLTRIVLLVLSPIALLLGVAGTWEMLKGPWSISMLVTALVMLGALYMQGRSFMTLIDKDVRAYFR